jgi:hypothetical protein
MLVAERGATRVLLALRIDARVLLALRIDARLLVALGVDTSILIALRVDARMLVAIGLTGFGTSMLPETCLVTGSVARATNSSSVRACSGWQV